MEKLTKTTHTETVDGYLVTWQHIDIQSANEQFLMLLSVDKHNPNAIIDLETHLDIGHHIIQHHFPNTTKRVHLRPGLESAEKTVQVRTLMFEETVRVLSQK